MCSPRWERALQTPCTASPSHAPALPEEQPKVISETLRGLFKAAAAGGAPAGLGRGRRKRFYTQKHHRLQQQGWHSFAPPLIGAEEPNQLLNPSILEMDTSRAGSRVLAPGSHFLGLLCSTGSQTYLQSLRVQGVPQHLLWGW